MTAYHGSDGEQLSFSDDGDGAPVVMLPGGAARHPDYLADFGGVADRRRITVQLRGVGDSPMSATRERNSWWRQAEDIAALRDHLGVDRLTIVAHSAGTRLAVAYAAQYPSDVERLLLVTPPAGYLVDVPDDTDRIRDRRRGDPEFEAALLRLSEGPSDSDAEFTAWHRSAGAVGYASWGPRQIEHSRVGTWNFAAVRQFFSVPPPDDLAGRLAEVAAPVLVVAGAEDALTGVDQAVAMAELFPHGESSVIDGSGHYPWIDQPEAFAEVVADFLAGLRGRQVDGAPLRPCGDGSRKPVGRHRWHQVDRRVR
ncbi:pimeloyl-ACP methyl ester carboxylesterase [Stackebrandtia endophytica]|uniref:Pimeloyl-ACP methyl ester carboxylesterase n=1 Tax=Stackebrandtia endophytica TaxID=1496996 RepID=A0A543ASQ3_9ACTN|nr:alpha/beta hydrolase [Stackebrandtia endophytica]TQL75614.1 pimeloyl-ACP methyl ester carboxylesterase [Stackebrandtia endophytica]